MRGGTRASYVAAVQPEIPLPRMSRATGPEIVRLQITDYERQLWSKVKAGRDELVSFSVVGETLPNGFTFWRCTASSWVD